jgi:hypothetical protein
LRLGQAKTPARAVVPAPETIATAAAYLLAWATASEGDPRWGCAKFVSHSRPSWL